MWHVSSRSGVATLRTAIHFLLTYSLAFFGTDSADPRTTFTDTSEHIRFLLFSSFLPLFSCWFRAVDLADLCRLLSVR